MIKDFFFIVIVVCCLAVGMRLLCSAEKLQTFANDRLETAHKYLKP